jgi:hypothetical protein
MACNKTETIIENGCPDCQTKEAEVVSKDGGIWICETCKKVLGPIIDDDTQCDCNDYYDWEYSRYVPQSAADNLTTQLERLTKRDKEVGFLVNKIIEENNKPPELVNNDSIAIYAAEIKDYLNREDVG